MDDPTHQNFIMGQISPLWFSGQNEAFEPEWKISKRVQPSCTRRYSWSTGRSTFFQITFSVSAVVECCELAGLGSELIIETVWICYVGSLDDEFCTDTESKFVKKTTNKCKTTAKSFDTDYLALNKKNERNKTTPLCVFTFDKHRWQSLDLESRHTAFFFYIFFFYYFFFRVCIWFVLLLQPPHSR